MPDVERSERFREGRIPTPEEYAQEYVKKFAGLLLTLTAVMTVEKPENMRARAERNGYKNGTKYGSLESQIMYDPKCAKMLPTPQAMDGTDVRSIMGKNDVLVETASGLRRVVQTGSDFGVSLGFMANNGLLPTPMARDEKNPSSPDGERINRKIKQGFAIELNDLAAMGVLPTLTARDWKPCVNPEAMTRRDGVVRDDQLANLPTMLGLKERGGITFRLSPLFTEEMMGFPSLWTTLPFLSPSGAPKASKPTAMPSSPR
jgi:hypothetical protein